MPALLKNPMIVHRVFRLGTPEHDHVYYCAKFSAGQISLTDHGYVWRGEKRGCVAAFSLRS